MLMPPEDLSSSRTIELVKLPSAVATIERGEIHQQAYPYFNFTDSTSGTESSEAKIG